MDLLQIFMHESIKMHLFMDLLQNLVCRSIKMPHFMDSIQRSTPRTDQTETKREKPGVLVILLLHYGSAAQEFILKTKM